MLLLPSNPWTMHLAQVCRLILEPTVLAFLHAFYHQLSTLMVSPMCEAAPLCQV